MPVWGIWLDGVFYFGTDRASRKAKNLTLNPSVAVHLESGDDAIILEGTLYQVSDPDLLKQIDEAYFTKYHIHVLDHNSDAGLFYALDPRIALAWLESDFVNSATRWQFD